LFYLLKKYFPKTEWGVWVRNAGEMAGMGSLHLVQSHASAGANDYVVLNSKSAMPSTP